MSSFTFLVLCIQACLIQTAFSQVIPLGFGGISNSLGAEVGLAGAGYAPLSSLGSLGSLGSLSSLSSGAVASSGFAPVPDVAAITSLPATGPYVANGVAEMSVAGDVVATGSTLVTGQVPVMGAVSFSGQIPAYGVVSVAGNCGCAGGLPL